MEAYPEVYTSHNLPLVLLSGLGERDGHSKPGTHSPQQESGSRILLGSPECTSDRAGRLLDQLLGHDGTEQPWNSTALPGPPGNIKYRMKTIGRAYTLPPRKAAPLPQSPGAEGPPVQHRSVELHSPLSPLSPSSPLYPDGIFTTLWLSKHNYQVPSVLIAFFELSTDDNVASDEQLQTDISAAKLSLSRSGFKTRLAVVLLSEKSILRAPELEDRLSVIRKATSLDSKSLFFMPPMSSQAEIATFVQSLLTTLQPGVVEYYRDLGKLARRKKGRGGIAASVTTPLEHPTHALSTPGWNVRYEVKQAIFAEFRQEMDVAERHYSAAIEELFSAEGVFETSPSWAPRWAEARLLCDALALRALRCQLWNSLTSSAAEFWVNFKNRMRDLIDRRGKGSSTYGWDAWEARWAEIMAQSIQRAALPTLQPAVKLKPDESVELRPLQLFAAPEKSLATSERLAPFFFLHHAGYWFRLALLSSIARRTKALAIPEDDRVPPGQSPASAVAHRAKNYDTYLVPEPHEEHPSGQDGAYDHLADFVRLTEGAVHEFAARDQLRIVERLKFDLADQLASGGRHSEALDYALPVWKTCDLREDNWDDLLWPNLQLIHSCAARSGSAEVHLATAWELLASPFPPIQSETFEDYYTRHWPEANKVTVIARDRERRCPFGISVTFGDRETFVGESLECQLTLLPTAAARAAGVRLTKVTIRLSNNRNVVLVSGPAPQSAASMQSFIELGEASGPGDETFETDLTMLQQLIRTFSFRIIFRESAPVHVIHAAVEIDNPRFHLQHILWPTSFLPTSNRRAPEHSLIEHRIVEYENITSVMVHPKPPKMQLLIHNLRKQYFTDECVKFDIDLVNEEVETVDATVEFTLGEQSQGAVTVKWAEETDAEVLGLGEIEASATKKAMLLVMAPAQPFDATIMISARYTLRSESGLALIKELALEVSFVVPFEAKYSFGPVLHPDAWPSYFDGAHVGGDSEAEGIPHRWRLGCMLQSTAAEDLLVHQTRLVLAKDCLDAVITLPDILPAEAQSLTLQTPWRTGFEFVTQKHSVDDRRPTFAELSLEVEWSHEGTPDKVWTALMVPRLTLPSSEPRVLCSVGQAAPTDYDLMLHYHLENPSAHFLTFALTMEASDEFAFSGPKYRTLSVAPLSRLRIDYRVCVHGGTEMTSSAADEHWIHPLLQVVDSYYKKALRVHAAGPGVRVDDKGALSVLVRESS